VTDDITIDVATEADWDAVYETFTAAFNEEGSEAISAAERIAHEPARTLVARRGGGIVGTAGILTRQLAIPGGVLPAAHVTIVAVSPTVRRQGILTRFMRRQFADARAAGEPIAVLWASEGRIYQRFGYGLAATKLSLTIDNREVTLPPSTDSGTLREGSPAELRDVLVKMYEAEYAQRPGWSERAERHWDYRLADVEAWRRGATALRAVLHEGSGGVDGYALWRGAPRWSDTGPNGEVRVVEIVAGTTEAYLALWRFLLKVDLTRSTHCWTCAPDEPLLAAISDPRRLDARLADALWLRITDLPAALSARRYAADVDVVIEVSDDWVPENAGRWRLTGSPTGATCTSTVDGPDLACDVRALGAAYLGGTSLHSLAATGQVRELTPGALARASVAFGWLRAPTSIEVF
jgi:predicted acetyltransferase